MHKMIFGEHDQDTIKQFENTLKDERVVDGVLCADGHKGYAFPIGGVVAYRDAISPSGVGYDIGCGNKVAHTFVHVSKIQDRLEELMDEIFHTISFGVGRANNQPVYHPLFDDDPAWDIPYVASLRDLAINQLGTVGSGNHYVDLLTDTDGYVWVGVHFGSRGLGHKIASYYIKQAGGKDGMDVDPVIVNTNTYLGDEYIAAMRLAGRYAYAGRDWVVNKVTEIIGGEVGAQIHNHHNFAWQEAHYGQDLWVVRKGATPAFPGQYGFVGGSMGDLCAIIVGVESQTSENALYSTVHGAGRVMSRTRAAGKRKWIKGRPQRVTEGEISRKMMMDWLEKEGVVLRGAGTDEAPQAYRRLPEVLEFHADTIEVREWLKPIGVAMAGEDEIDPYKD